jgi:hypothetical protein
MPEEGLACIFKNHGDGVSNHGDDNPQLEVSYPIRAPERHPIIWQHNIRKRL